MEGKAKRQPISEHLANLPLAAGQASAPAASPRQLPALCACALPANTRLPWQRCRPPPTMNGHSVLGLTRPHAAGRVRGKRGGTSLRRQNSPHFSIETHVSERPVKIAQRGERNKSNSQAHLLLLKTGSRNKRKFCTQL